MYPIEFCFINVYFKYKFAKVSIAQHPASRSTIEVIEIRTTTNNVLIFLIDLDKSKIYAQRQFVQ